MRSSIYFAENTTGQLANDARLWKNWRVSPTIRGFRGMRGASRLLIGKRRFTDFVLVLTTRYVNVLRWLLAKVSARNILDVQRKGFFKLLTINGRRFTIND